MKLKKKYPEMDKTLTGLDADMGRIAQYMAVPPLLDVFARIEDSIDDLIIVPDTQIMRPVEKEWRQNSTAESKGRYIEVEAQSNYMCLHKNWKWVFAAVFVLGKIFLGCAIYFYLASKQAKQQLQEFKTQINTLKQP